jgi:hypothetical protein
MNKKTNKPTIKDHGNPTHIDFALEQEINQNID